MNNDITAFNPNSVNIATSTFEIFHYRQPSFKYLDFHNHDFYEFYIFLDGMITYYIEENAYELSAGDILVIPAGKMHRPVITQENALYERFVLSVNTDFIRSIDDSRQTLVKMLQKIEETKRYLFTLKQPDLDFIVEILHRLIDLNTQNSEMIFKVPYLIIFFEQIKVRLLHDSHESFCRDESDIIPQVIRYINEHLTEKLTLEDISSRFFISKYYLIRKFKSYTNATVYDYIISKRIVLAKKLIRKGISATDTCMQCGFTDYSNFYKAFAEKSGLTPAEFKASVKS